MTQNLLRLKRNILIMIMINELLLQSIILLAADFFKASLAQAHLITKTDFDAKLSIRNRRITSNKLKH